MDMRAECLPAPPTGDERRRQTSVTTFIRRDCKPVPPFFGGGTCFACSARAANEKSFKVEKIRMLAATWREPSMHADRDILCRAEPMLGSPRAEQSSVARLYRRQMQPRVGEAETGARYVNRRRTYRDDNSGTAPQKGNIQVVALNYRWTGNKVAALLRRA